MEEKLQLSNNALQNLPVHFQRKITADGDRKIRDCHHCRFCDQDVDSYPCDRCHTRH